MGELKTIEHGTSAPVASQAITPMEMINKAVADGRDVDMISKLMDLEARWQATQGRREFDQAISAAKSEIGPIQKNRKSHNGRYADFSAIAKAIDPILAKNGLSYRFRTRQENAIEVTCILAHVAGHCEESTLRGPEDKSGSKNPIQAIGSTLSYLQRYTLIQAVGLSVSEDDDGNASHRSEKSETISPDQLKELQAMIDRADADTQWICDHYKVEALINLTGQQFEHCARSLKQRIAARAAEAQGEAK